MSGDIVEVPQVWDMTDEIFLKHLEARHSDEVHLPGTLNAAEAWVNTYRTFHDRLHQIAVPGQYDHVHEEDEEIEDEEDDDE